MKSLVMLFMLLAGQAGAEELYGVGATFPAPLYAKMFAEYQTQTGQKVIYDALGSGNGQKAILNRVADFGASDVWMSPEALAGAPGKILHIPTAIGAVVPVYLLPGLKAALKLDGPTLAAIYLGKIKTWNDPALVKLNPDVALPAQAINVLYRDDASGTSRIFTDYLGKVSPDWKKAVGESGTPKWPIGEGAKGSDGVATKLKMTTGGIAYMELAYAKKNKLAFATMKNRAGKFVVADNDTARAAADGADLPAADADEMTDSPQPGAYPISGYTYALVYQEQKYGNRTLKQAQALRDLLTWMVGKGQQYNEPLDYARLPDSVIKGIQKSIASMTYGGKGF